MEKRASLHNFSYVAALVRHRSRQRRRLGHVCSLINARGSRRRRLVASLTCGLTILLICEKLSPFGGAITRWPAAPGGGRGVGNLIADGRSRTRGQARRGSVVRCPLFRAASAGQA